MQSIEGDVARAQVELAAKEAELSKAWDDRAELIKQMQHLEQEIEHTKKCLEANARRLDQGKPWWRIW